MPRKSRKKSYPSIGRDIRVRLRQNPYNIHIASHDVAGLCAALAQYTKGHPLYLLTNRRVGKRLLPPLMKGLERRRVPALSLNLPDGERYKTLATVEKCYDWLLSKGADRQSVLVLLGGGVLGDIGGYVAATFMRGIRFVQVPTTLVAQVDSSVGGKVGVDHPAGKNLIGAFYQPLYVHIDVAYLSSLPEREYRCGLAEVIKYAVIQDAGLFRFLREHRDAVLRRDSKALVHIVRTCCAIKARIVERDERESRGERMILNFGHTVGHAIESRTAYKKYRHGEAVAMGMVAASRISHRLGTCDETTVKKIVELITEYGLPSQWPTATLRQWEMGFSRDKKMRGDKLNFVVVNKIGSVGILGTTPREVAQHLNAKSMKRSSR